MQFRSGNGKSRKILYILQHARSSIYYAMPFVRHTKSATWFIIQEQPLGPQTAPNDCPVLIIPPKVSSISFFFLFFFFFILISPRHVGSIIEQKKYTIISFNVRIFFLSMVLFLMLFLFFFFAFKELASSNAAGVRHFLAGVSVVVLFNGISLVQPPRTQIML